MKYKKLAAAVLAAAITASCAAVSTSAAVTSDTGITVHYYCKDGTPSVYYWNSLPDNIETDYPGVKMKKDSAEGDNWYSYTFDDVSKINMQFINGDSVSDELTRKAAGEYWYYNGKWASKNPMKTNISDYQRSDLREESIYFVVTTRFYDGDPDNNVHCWDDNAYNNPDTDPAWRGDFKGLIDKLDYIKALGFSAVWVTPVVENASGYDYHGYHAFDFSKVDPRYESEGATFQDLIDACHEKDMKLIQDVVWNHTGNFGEANFCELFTKEYDDIKDLENIEKCMIPTDTLLNTYGLKSAEDYWKQPGGTQYDQRLNIMKDTNVSTNNATESPLKDVGDTGKVSTGSVYNADNYYHNGHWQSLNWDDWTCKYTQIAGDCVDLNTENPAVAEKLVDIYSDYIDMGVDAFRVDTVRHMPRLSLNMMFLPQLPGIDENFYMFGEVCTRYSQIWYRGHASESVPFYTWKESDPSYAEQWQWGTDAKSINKNMDLTLEHWSKCDNTNKQPTSTNALLNGNDYHTPDYSEFSGMGAIDFTVHYNFSDPSSAYNLALAEDKYFNDSTWNVVYVDSHDYGPQPNDKLRFNGGTAAWAENLSLMFTFRGIPCIYYGSEVEFKKGVMIDGGENHLPLEQTGRAYFGNYIEGDVKADDFAKYTASGNAADTLNKPLSKHLQRLNLIRRAVPALQKGQYSTSGCTGKFAFKRRYTDENVDSYALVAVSGKATFSNVENGTYYEAVTGNKVTVTNGTLVSDSIGQGNIRVYVLDTKSNTVKGKIGTDGSYIK
ncbi:MAG: starch-binding protein [Clostridia bacterium]|nr:starch-binding protein [Clostridia bacterium]